MTTGPFPAPPGFMWIFVPKFWHWRARRYIHASEKGKQAFCLLVRISRR